MKGRCDKIKEEKKTKALLIKCFVNDFAKGIISVMVTINIRISISSVLQQFTLFFRGWRCGSSNPESCTMVKILLIVIVYIADMVDFGGLKH
jgi:hypothetical protein